MKNVARYLGLIVAMLTAVSLNAAAQRIRDGICVYEDNYFHGWEECFAVGDQIPDLQNRRNKISSIRIYGNAEAVMYTNKNFDGVALDVRSDVNDMAQVPLTSSPLAPSWNDVVESLQVRPRVVARNRRNDDYRVDPRVPPPPVFPQAGVCFFEDSNYSGRYECFEPRFEAADLGRSWSDRVSSIRVFGPTRVTLYRDINFRGETLVLDRDVPNLRQLRLRGSVNWDNQVSSFYINGGRGRAYGRNR
jgi:hypothetical protein